MHFFRAFGHGAIVDDGPCLCGVINFCLGSLLARVALTWKPGHGTVSSAILSGLTRRGMVCGVFAASFEREGPHDVHTVRLFRRAQTVFTWLVYTYPIRMGRERGLRGAAARFFPIHLRSSVLKARRGQDFLPLLLGARVAGNLAFDVNLGPCRGHLGRQQFLEGRPQPSVHVPKPNLFCILLTDALGRQDRRHTGNRVARAQRNIFV